MKAIKCPNCGSEQVKELTEEKYACMACDNVFLIHNHSKEFRKTDEHISSMHQDLKDDISKLINSSNIDPDAIIEKAEQHLKKKDWDIASDLYDKASQENPDKSKAWYGLYRSLTGDLKLLTDMPYSYVMAIILMMMIKKWEVRHFSMKMVL